MPYQEQSFNLPTMEGISAKQIEAHLKLYAGYVKNVNALELAIDELKKDLEKNTIALSELTRRYGFEWNGMRLHEIYFSSLGGDGNITGKLANAITTQFGSVEAWKADMKRIALMRGTGWALLVHDRVGNQLKNIWISDHEIGHLAGCNVLFALDVWEHAYLLDLLPSQRGEYIETVFKHFNWNAIEARF